jgi:hypothetical protein
MAQGSNEWLKKIYDESVASKVTFDAILVILEKLQFDENGKLKITST